MHSGQNLRNSGGYGFVPLSLLIPKNSRGFSHLGQTELTLFKGTESIRRRSSMRVARCSTVSAAVSRPSWEVGDAWLATATGIYASSLSLFERAKISRLLLIKPDPDGYLKEFAKAVPDWSANRLAELIKTTTQHAQAAGVEVRWYDGPIMGALYGDPYSDQGWCRIEEFIPYHADRMGYLIRGEVFPALRRILVAAFDRQWQEARSASEADLLPALMDETGKRRAFKESLRSYRNRIWDDLPVAESEFMFHTFRQLGDYIEDVVGKEERDRFWSDEGIDDPGLDTYGRRLACLENLLDRVDDIPLRPDAEP